jgi:glutathione synthase
LTTPHCYLLQVYGAGIADPAVALVHAPFSLLPMPFPADTFAAAKQAATVFNAMIDRVAEDEAYLHRVLSPAAKFDSFTVSSVQHAF